MRDSSTWDTAVTGGTGLGSELAEDSGLAVNFDCGHLRIRPVSDVCVLCVMCVCSVCVCSVCDVFCVCVCV